MAVIYLAKAKIGLQGLYHIIYMINKKAESDQKSRQHQVFVTNIWKLSSSLTSPFADFFIQFLL